MYIDTFSWPPPSATCKHMNILIVISIQFHLLLPANEIWSIFVPPTHYFVIYCDLMKPSGIKFTFMCTVYTCTCKLGVKSFCCCKNMCTVTKLVLVFRLNLFLCFGQMKGICFSYCSSRQCNYMKRSLQSFDKNVSRPMRGLIYFNVLECAQL